MADEPVAAFEEPLTTKVRRWLGRHRTLAVASATAFLVGTVMLAIALVSLRAARNRAENNLQLAKAAVDRSLTAFSDDPRLRAVGLERFRREILALATSFYEIFAREQSDAQLEVERGNQLVKYAKLTEELGEATEAIPFSERACSIFDGLVQRDPTSLEYVAGLARALDSLGSNFQVCHRPGEAKTVLERGVTIWRRLAAARPGSVEYRHKLAITLNRLARVCWQGLQDADGCRLALTESLELCKHLVAEQPESPEYQDAYAEALLLTGHQRTEALLFTGQAQGGADELQQARETLEQSISIREEVAARFPQSLEYQYNLVESCVMVAGVYSNVREPEKVAAIYQKVRGISERLAREHPDVAQFSERRRLIEILHLISVARSGDHARAVLGVETALGESPSGMTLLFAACCECVSSVVAGRDAQLGSAERSRIAGKYQDRAMELLQAARQTGLFRQPYQIGSLKSTDPDLAPLRGRPDFQKLIAELELELPKTAATTRGQVDSHLPAVRIDH